MNSRFNLILKSVFIISTFNDLTLKYIPLHILITFRITLSTVIPKLHFAITKFANNPSNPIQFDLCP